MNDFADLRAALAAVHAAEYPSDRDVALARLGAAATPEVVQRLLDHGMWWSIVADHAHLIGKQFRDERKGHRFMFFGLVHADDDYYYGMYSEKHGLRLLSCVGDSETFGFVEVVK